MEAGTMTVFTSSEIPNPNSAQYDNKIFVEDRVDAYIGPALTSRGRCQTWLLIFLCNTFYERGEWKHATFYL